MTEIRPTMTKVVRIRDGRSRPFCDPAIANAAPVVVVEVMYRIGFRIEPKNRTGFAHLFEHLMFQGSEHVGKFEHVRIVNENGGTLNGSTRFDHTNYFDVMPSNALELAMWLEADRMRSLKITPENLKNQQDVVSEEVRVNVLNQPYGAFEWLGLPQKANTNWYNAHNLYGDLRARSRRAASRASRRWRRLSGSVRDGRARDSARWGGSPNPAAGTQLRRGTSGGPRTS
jgi:Insulinase (Peptidase family M16)